MSEVMTNMWKAVYKQLPNLNVFPKQQAKESEKDSPSLEVKVILENLKTCRSNDNNPNPKQDLKKGPGNSKGSSKEEREPLEMSEYVSVHEHSVNIAQFGHKAFYYLHKKRLAERGFRLSKRKLGEGGFGIVYKVYKHPEKTVLACKISLVRESTRNSSKDIRCMLKSISNEVYVLKKTSHDNLIKLNRNFVYNRKNTASMDVATMMVHSYIVMEYASEGTLYSKLKKNGAFESGLARYYFKQIAHGLLELHRHGIAHRDLKLGNILLTSNSQDQDVVKIADFGLSQLLYTQRSALMKCLKPAGTLSYMSPELINSYILYNTHNRVKMRLYDPFKTDIWALSVSLFLLLNKLHPFGNPPSRREDKLDFAQRVHQKQLNHQLDVSDLQRGVEPFTGECLDLFHKMFEPEPRKRVSIYELVEHGWMKMEVIIGMSTPKSKPLSAVEP